MIENNFEKFENELEKIMNLAPSVESWDDLFSLINNIYYLFVESKKSDFDYNY